LHFQVKDIDMWTEQCIADLRSKHKISALVDRQRTSIFLCGAVDDVNVAAQYMTDFEKALLDETGEAELQSDENDGCDSDAGILELPKIVSQGESLDADVASRLHAEEVLNADGASRLQDEEALANKAEKYPDEAQPQTMRAEKAPAFDSNVNVPGQASPSDACQPTKGRACASVFDPGDAESDDETEFVWYYVDDEDIIQGPFDRDEMEEWWRLDLLPEDLLVVCCSSSIMPPDDKSNFRPISELNDILNGVHNCDQDAPLCERGGVALGFEDLIEQLGA
jgi:hypothetical protein